MVTKRRVLKTKNEKLVPIIKYLNVLIGQKFIEKLKKKIV